MISGDGVSNANEEALILRVAEAEAGLRLDAYLANQIEDWSRAQLQRLIEEEDVLVNGKPAKASYKVHANDEIAIELTRPPATNFVPEDIPINVVYEDDELIIVNKPAGIVVHPAAGIVSGTLANALAYHFSRLSLQPGTSRPGIVHRLDKNTSGLLVVAKTDSACEHLANQFRAREVFKSYVALAHGIVQPNDGRIAEPIGRDPANRTKMAVVRTGRSALTLYRVRRYYERCSLLDVDLRTGRTHQIRVHLAWLKHPVVGDELYGSGRDNTVSDPQFRREIRKLGRQFLHAERLEFRHPRTGDTLRFEAPLPSELSAILTLLEAGSR